MATANKRSGGHRRDRKLVASRQKPANRYMAKKAGVKVKAGRKTVKRVGHNRNRRERVLNQTRESTVPSARHPTFLSGSPDKHNAFQREVKGRFGLVPNFFSSAPDAPELVERLWEFAKAGYLDNPLPSIFKERLFVYLSRFCEVRYCIVRHCAFLLGYGHAAGDRAAIQSLEQVIRLLKSLPPWQRDLEEVYSSLEALPAGKEWPAPETEAEDLLITIATVVFVEPARSDRPRKALRRVLGGNRFEHLLGLLAFIRTAHYWTLLHHDLTLEADARELLAANEELARLLLQDEEAARCDMGKRLFTELEELRDLNERQELEKAKQALEVLVQQKELLLKEVNHRVKNSLQIVSSVLYMQLPYVEGTAANALHNASARVLAIAAVHERLYTGNDVTIVRLDTFLSDLCHDIGRAFNCPDGIETNLEVIEVPTDMAVPLALIVNELVTNVIKHVGPPCRIELRGEAADILRLTITDKGSGPSQELSQPGLGSRIVEVLSKQIGANVATKRVSTGYAIELKFPLVPGTVIYEGPYR